MGDDQSIRLLEKQIEELENVKMKEPFSQNFTKWQRNTEITIHRIFGSNSRHLDDFKSIKYSIATMSRESFEKHFRKKLDDAEMILASMIEEITEYGIEDNSILNFKDRLQIIFDRFHIIARQLRDRYNSRPTLEIEDEYDVQDLLHALLRVDFMDVRPEEWAPSYAGSSSRMDFLLKNEEIIIEVKKTRKSLGAKEVGEQLIVDIAKYKTHPNCSALYCFVYDPEGRIGNPIAIENDLTQTEPFPVIVFVRPSN